MNDVEMEARVVAEDAELSSLDGKCLFNRASNRGRASLVCVPVPGDFTEVSEKCILRIFEGTEAGRQTEILKLPGIGLISYA